MYNIRSTKNKSLEKRIRLLCKNTPGYISEFSAFLSDYSPSTRYAYLFSIVQYLEYLHAHEEKYSVLTYPDIPLSVFLNLSSSALDAYLAQMKMKNRVDRSEKDIAPLYQNRILAAFRAFYRYLESAGIHCDCPVPKTKRKKVVRNVVTPLSRPDFDQLVHGIQTNDLYLLRQTDENGNVFESLIPIPDEIALKRHRTIKRNTAILFLMANEGLTVTEIAGLDTKSIDFTSQNILIRNKKGDLTEVSCSEETLSALHDYLFSDGIPDELSGRQEDVDAFVDFCKTHMTDPSASKKAVSAFHNNDPQFSADIELGCMYLRESGRDSFYPNQYDDSLFLSNRSKRISVRMIEQMVSDMAKTYLPELTKERNIGPDAIRMSATLSKTTSLV